MKPHILRATLAVSFVLRPASFAAPPPSIIVILTDDRKVEELDRERVAKANHALWQAT